MAKKKNNTAMRVLLPLAMLVVGVGVAVSVSINTSRQGQTPAPDQEIGQQVDQQADQDEQPGSSASTDPEPSPPPADPTTEPATDTADSSTPPDTVDPTTDLASNDPDEAQPADDTPPGASDLPTVQSTTIDPLAGLHAAELGDPAVPLVLAPLGSLDETSDDFLRIEFSRYGAGITQLRLSRYLVAAHAKAESGTRPDEDFVSVQHEYDYQNDGVTPMSVWAVQINGTIVPLQGIAGSDGLEKRMWLQEAPGRFRAQIVNAAGDPVLDIVRTFTVKPSSYNIRIDHLLTNHTSETLTVRLVQIGPVELEQIASYGGDKRRVRYGFLSDPSQDPSQQLVLGDKLLKARRQLVGKRDKATGRYASPAPYWPTDKKRDIGKSLAWIAQTNRYFGAAVFAPIDEADPAPDKALRAAPLVERTLLDRGSSEPVLALRLTSEPMTLTPAGTSDAQQSLDMGLFAGPLSKRVIAADAMRKSLAMDTLVAYNFGGFCAICTFSWLTGPLIALLRFVHENLVFDWALSIIVLVLIVRTILHPVTKWSQIKMQRFTKQMQAIGPKQKQIQERYKDDRKKLQQEMGKLWREEGISPTGMLGCLPMFLQTPVWIALYATLYYAIELRDQSAFFGLFQSFNGWVFLADLSEPDRFINFPNWSGISIPIMGVVNSVNIMPLFLGIVFFMHQKYMTPPSTGTMSPEQESTQKIMKVMMVVMFPLLMYNAPSGLAMYFIANSTLGIIETKWIRAHMAKNDLLNPEKAKKPKKPGFFARMQKLAEKQQKLRQQQKSAQQGHARTGSKGRSTDDQAGRYKKRK